MAERNQKFWLDNELKLITFESEWYKKLSDGESLNPSKDYSMNEELDGHLERTLGNHLALVGPMFDSYLQELGKAMFAKLSRGNITGLAVPIVIFLHWQIQKSIAGLCTGYGADIEVKYARDVKKETLVIYLYISTLNIVQRRFGIQNDLMAQITCVNIYSRRH